MPKKMKKIVLPESQWSSSGWTVEWRRGNASRDRYELCYQVQHEANIVVTRAGWKWTEPNPRLSAMRALSAPWVWSPAVFETWQEAAADYARHRQKRRKRRTGQNLRLPGDWIPVAHERGRPRTPWTPRPVHADFSTLERPDGGAS